MRRIEARTCVPFLILPLLILLTGCSGLEVSKGPDVSLADLKLTDLTLLETSGVLTVRLANENLEPMVVSGGAYDLSLGGIRIGKGLSDQRVEVPKLGTATVDIDLHISNLALATRIRGLIEKKVVDYRLKGKVYVDRPTGTRRYKVLRDGRFDFNEGILEGTGY